MATNNSTTLTPIAVRNMRWTNTSSNHIFMEVQFQEFAPQWLPFGANAQDSHEHGQNLFANAVAGLYGEIAPYVPPVK